MKYLPFLLAIIAITSLSAQSIVTDDTVKDLLIKNDNQVKILYFTASWCGPCQSMKPAIQSLEADESLNLRIYSMDIDSNLTDDYLRINAVPTFYYFKNGIKLKESTGAKRAYAIKKTVLQFQKVNPQGEVFLFAPITSAYTLLAGHHKDLSVVNLEIIWHNAADLQLVSLNILQDLTHPKDLTCGLQLIQRAYEIHPSGFNLFIKARFLNRLNKPDEALATAQEVLLHEGLSQSIKKKVDQFIGTLK